ncbi:MAG: ABC transporter substrate-binding protein [Desulfotignum sp.]|nr:ABC transporter substrate-binding protein [Desulfotignum sp.]MCF8126776.1 ABC transporter substrate-binding protein [Desulfotignum sp.]
MVLFRLLVLIILSAAVFWAGECDANTHVIIDDKGRHINVKQPFKRIISLYGAHTENLFHLGLESEIIGVSINDRFPPQVQHKKRFSFHDDAEKFVVARPDLVLIRPMIDNGYPGLVNQLERYHITVVSLQPADVDDMFKYWQTLGRLTGRLEAAEQLVADFQQKTRLINTRLPAVQDRKKVYFEAIHSRMKTFTHGSMAIYALESAGGINVAADAPASRNTNIANYSKEKILAKAHDIDVFLAQKGIMNPVSIEQILNEPGFHILKAVKDNQVYLIDENIVSRPVPRLFQGIMTIGKLLYPDIFTTIEKDL